MVESWYQAQFCDEPINHGMLNQSDKFQFSKYEFFYDCFYDISGKQFPLIYKKTGLGKPHSWYDMQRISFHIYFLISHLTVKKTSWVMCKILLPIQQCSQHTKEAVDGYNSWSAPRNHMSMKQGYEVYWDIFIIQISVYYIKTFMSSLGMSVIQDLLKDILSCSTCWFVIRLNIKLFSVMSTCNLSFQV